MSKRFEKLNFIDIVGTNNKPPSIKKVVKVGSMTKTANSYVYEFECMDTGMKYIGYHKDNGKTYWNSSTDGNFRKVLADSNSNLIFKVLAYGSVKEMLQKEHELLTLVDAKNNSMYWNKTNGQSGVLPIDRKAIHKIVKIVEKTDKKNLDTSKTISELYHTPVGQSRELLIDRDNLNEIKDSITRQAGNTDKADPPVLLEGRVFEGVFHEFLRIGGNHTVTSYWELNYKDTELPVIIIPKELHESITDDGLTLLGNLLNKKTSISAPATHEDGTKTLYEYHLQGRDWRNSDCSNDLFDMGLSSGKVSTAVKNCQAMIDNDDKRKSGWVVMDYLGKHDYILNDEMENWEINSPSTYVNSSSSAAITMDRILDDFDKNKLDNQDEIRWFVYHPNKSTMNVTWPKLRNKLENCFLKYSNVKIVFKSMALYTKSV